MSREKYRPSNGSEGEWFVEEYCMQCLHCDPDPCGPKQCEILCATLVFGVDEPGYPKEWTYNEKNEPICTKWQKWDWGTDGDPDDSDNPKAPIPDSPLQLKLPIVMNEILEGHTVKETEKA